MANPSASTPESGLPEMLDSDQLYVPPHYLLPPFHPSPFQGTLEASLDALLEFGRLNPTSMPLMNELRKSEPIQAGRFNLLFAALESDQQNIFPSKRRLLEELLFLATRTLLPEQITQNRARMHSMYNARCSLSWRVILRYDMLLEWTKQDHHWIAAESRPPTRNLGVLVPPKDYDKLHPGRRPLVPNVWATLIAAPPEGYRPVKVHMAMKHHVTKLDKWLMFRDEEVAGWDTQKLVHTVLTVLLHWRWLRENTERMESMEAMDWEELDGRADECMWVRDDKRAKA